MKCSDLSNEIRPRAIANIWAQRINKEFFAQADKEKELNLKVSAWMDYTKIVLAKEQMNFIGGLCLPLYALFMITITVYRVALCNTLIVRQIQGAGRRNSDGEGLH